MVYRRDRVVWGAVLFRTTNPEVVEGAIVRRSVRLHWTSQSARRCWDGRESFRKPAPLRGSNGRALKTLRSVALPTTAITLL